MDTTITGQHTLNIGPQNYESAEAENARMKVVFANRGEVSNPRHTVADQPLTQSTVGAPELSDADAAHAAAYLESDATHTAEKAASIAEEIAREKALADERLAALQAPSA